MTRPGEVPPTALLLEACARVGLDGRAAEPRRLAENEHWRLPPDVIVRIGQPGQVEAENRAIRIARWLASNDLSTPTPLGLVQPVVLDGRPVTFWHEVPPHEQGSIEELATTLKALHALPLPEFALPRLDPFVRVRDRIENATTLSREDASWLLALHDDLAAQWEAGLPSNRPECVLHGDAWPGNIVRSRAGVVVMDLERVSTGPFEWDLVSSAVRTFTTGAVHPRDYSAFCDTYGYDVTRWDGYPVFAGARELRITAYAAQHAARNSDWIDEAQVRVDCLRGRRGPRPWLWTGIM